jgi:hypothetical protein
VHFIQNLISNNTPVYILNDVSGHCYMVSAVQTLLLEKLRRKQKPFVEEDNECGCSERAIPRKSSQKSAIFFRMFQFPIRKIIK